MVWDLHVIRIYSPWRDEVEASCSFPGETPLDVAHELSEQGAVIFVNSYCGYHFGLDLFVLRPTLDHEKNADLKTLSTSWAFLWVVSILIKLLSCSTWTTVFPKSTVSPSNGLQAVDAKCRLFTWLRRYVTFRLVRGAGGGQQWWWWLWLCIMM